MKRERRTHLPSILAALDSAVSDGIDRMQDKSNFWGVNLLSRGKTIYEREPEFTERNIDSLVGQISGKDFRGLDRNGKALVVAGQEFIWGSRSFEVIVKYRNNLLMKASQGEELTDLEKTAVYLAYLDTDSF